MSEHLAPVITWRSRLVQESDCSICKLVGLALSLYMNERGGSAFPSVPTLAKDCSLSVRTVRQHLNEHLMEEGWLILVERGGTDGSTRRANEWRAAVPPAGDAGAPRQEVPGTPAGDAAQVVHGSDHEEVEDASVFSEAEIEQATILMDANLLCEHLADRIEENGSKRPTITKRWLDAARLLITKDGKTPEQVAACINWCQDDEFWRANILSMPKLREKYDQLRLQASRQPGRTARQRQRDAQMARLADAIEREQQTDRKELTDG